MNNEGFFNHSAIRSSDNKELCRIRIGWNKIKNQDLKITLE
jgi:hypothetical protein